MRNEPFLRNIINPLKTILSDDGSLMSWRLQEYAQIQPPQELVDLCDVYIDLRERIGDNTTSKRVKAMRSISQALLDIYIYLTKQEDKPPQDEPQEKDDEDDKGDEPAPLPPTKQGGGKGNDDDEDEDEPKTTKATNLSRQTRKHVPK